MKKRILAITLSVAMTILAIAPVGATEAVSENAEAAVFEDFIDETEENVAGAEEITEEDVTGISAAEAAALPEIKSEEWVTDKLTNDVQEKWYRFVQPSDGYFVITLRANENADGSKMKKGWRYYLYRKGDLINELRDIGGVVSESVGDPVIMGENEYYIHVVMSSKWNDEKPFDQPFDLQVHFTADETYEHEDNNDIYTANEIKRDTVYYGNTYNSDDMDYYQFTMPVTGYFTISLSADDKADADRIKKGWKVILYNDEQTEQYSMSDITIKETSIEMPYKKDKKMYVAVSDTSRWNDEKPTNVLYNLRVDVTETDKWEKEDNDSTDTATSILLNETLTGNARVASDDDWYKFSLSKKSKIKIDFHIPDVNDVKKGWATKIYNPNMEMLQESEKLNSVNSDIEEIELEKGTYFVEVSDFSRWNDEKPIRKKYELTIKGNASAQGKDDSSTSEKKDDSSSSSKSGEVTVDEEKEKAWKEYASSVSVDKVITGNSEIMIVGDTARVNVNGVYLSNIYTKGKAGSYDKGIATAVKKGSFKLMTTVSGKKKPKKVTVCKIKVENPKAKSQIKVKVGKTKNGKLKGTKQTVKYTVSNNKIATVSSDGKVTGVKSGTTTLTAQIGKHIYKSEIVVE